MMRTVQLVLTDAAFAKALREAICHSGPWHVATLDRPDFLEPCVVVLDECSLSRLPLPLANPERVVLVCRQDPELLAQAWDAGIVSVVSTGDSLATVQLAIMATSLRIGAPHPDAFSSAISPRSAAVSAPITPEFQTSRSRRCKSR